MRAADGIHHIPDLISQILLGEMRPGNVYRNAADVVSHVMPHLLVHCNMPDHVVVYLGDKTVLFEDGNEPSG